MSAIIMVYDMEGLQMTEKLNDPKARALELDGAKTFIRLDAATWKAIEMLAAQSLCDWDEWVRRAWEQIKAATDRDQIDSINRAGALRYFATLGLIRLTQSMAAVQRCYSEASDRTPEPMRRVSIDLASGVSLTLSRSEALAVVEKLNYALAMTGEKDGTGGAQ
jgi:predicted DNA-binding ribbon-helix-helix protein